MAGGRVRPPGGLKMLVAITRPMYEAAKKSLEAAPYYLSQDKFRFKEEVNVNLAKHKPEAVKGLGEILDGLKVAGAKVVARDCRNWLTAIESGGKETKMRRVRQFSELFRLFFKTNGRRRLYVRESDAGVEAAMLAYYIVKCVYHPKNDRTEAPEHVTVTLAYERFGKTHTTTVRYEAGELLNKTVPEVLIESGYVVEDDKTRSDYEHEADRYDALRDAVGKQMNCVGVASDYDIDGNSYRDNWWRPSNNLNLGNGGVPSRCVIDVFQEGDEDNRSRRGDEVSADYWNMQTNQDGESGDEAEDADAEPEQPDVPVHPYLVVFDLKRHLRLTVHVANCTAYIYDTKIRSKLIIPDDHSAVLDTLLASSKRPGFVDVIKNKAGGTIILCQGPPGVGKTLSAEVYAETLKMPLYSVQCSQLGIKVEDVEKSLMRVLSRGKRWGALTLLDEGDVYLHKRGNNLQQNAIVGVFLRVLEYYAGILFITTNRDDVVDDAILSRCTVRLEFKRPEPEAQKKIWLNLIAENKLEAMLSAKMVDTIVAKHPMSGRDIKNMLRLCAMVAHDRQQGITDKLVAEMKLFKPTCE